ncbi:MAG: 4'-phosphopantetheinyl transferase [Polaribacter sp.]|jgi:4'-phosphopantetheinyl transferase
MRKIYHADSRKLIAEQSLSSLYEGVPPEVKERAERFRFPRDAYNFVNGRILLQKGLRELGLDDDLSKIQYQENGKPQLDGVYFNISHSDHRVVCVLSTEGEIGVDVEVRGTIELESFVNYFTETEWSDINEADDPIGRFYFYWTRKEAVIKALGVTLSWLHDIELDAKGERFEFGGREWVLEEVELEVEKETYCVLCY